MIDRAVSEIEALVGTAPACRALGLLGRCAAVAVRGPFFVPVHLKQPYRRQRLLDSVTGFFHRLIPRSELH